MQRILHSCWYNLSQKFKHGTLIEVVQGLLTDIHALAIRYPYLKNDHEITLGRYLNYKFRLVIANLVIISLRSF